MTPIVTAPKFDYRRNIQAFDWFQATFTAATFPRRQNRIVQSMDCEMRSLPPHLDELPANKNWGRHGGRKR